MQTPAISTKPELSPDYLETPLFQLSPEDPFTIRQAMEGIMALGSLGSGKSSGFGQTLAKAMLRKGFGGLVLCVKPDERMLWEQYCEETNRTNDLIIFSPKHDHEFNFLLYELTRKGDGAGMVQNIVKLFLAVADLGEKKTGGESPGYWKNALSQLLSNAVELLTVTTGTVSINDLYKLVMSAPKDYEDLSSEDWCKNSYCGQLLNHLYAEGTASGEIEEYNHLLTYWTLDFPDLAEKTRSIVISSFTAICDTFLRKPLKNLFCKGVTLTPETIWEEGKIILLDMPVQEYGDLGRYCQLIWKQAYQKAVQRRNISEYPLPVFLWVDESQQFYSAEEDMFFQSTCRSSRAITVYITQSLPVYYAVAGGKRDEVEALLANFQTKVFMANGCSKTNTWASDTISKDKHSKFNTGINTGEGERKGNSQTFNISEVYEYELSPIEFTRLKKGGPPNDFNVEAIVFQAGMKWNFSGKSYMRVVFNQNAPASQISNKPDNQLPQWLNSLKLPLTLCFICRFLAWCLKSLRGKNSAETTFSKIIKKLCSSPYCL